MDNVIDTTIRTTNEGKVEAIVKYRCYTHIMKCDNVNDAIIWVKTIESELKNNKGV